MDKKVSKYSLDTFYTQPRKLIKEVIIDTVDYQYPRFNKYRKYSDGFYTETMVFLWSGIRVYKYTKRRCNTNTWTPYYTSKTKTVFHHSFHKYTQKKGD